MIDDELLGLASAAVKAALELHTPCTGQSVNTLDCPKHNLTGQWNFDCPTCSITLYETCSAWSCNPCCWPCETVRVIHLALGIEDEPCPDFDRRQGRVSDAISDAHRLPDPAG